MKDNEIEIEEDLKHQELAWKVKKTSYITIFALILAALLGLFGGGGLSNSEKGDKNKTWISFEKFLHAGRPAEMEINFTREINSPLSVFINNSFLKKIQIERIIPNPIEEKATADYTEFIFNSDKKPNTFIRWHYVPVKPGAAECVIRINTEKFNLQHLIYP
jgi:hypothetical protein